MIAHGSPTSAHSFVLFEGRRYPLSLEGRGWRLRSRSAKWPVDVLLGYGSRKWAEAEAKKRLREGALTKAKPCLGTLEELITAYKSMPKRAGVAAAAVAECRLRSCVRLVTGRELDAVKVSEINAAFWLRYTALRQGLPVADLSTRRVDGTAINAAMRQAASIFIPRLRPAFAALGFEIAPDASVIQWLPTIRTEKPNVGRNLIDDWRSLNCNVGRNSNDARGRTALWLAIGLARFAGLRRDEIERSTLRRVIGRLRRRRRGRCRRFAGSGVKQPRQLIRDGLRVLVVISQKDFGKSISMMHDNSGAVKMPKFARGCHERSNCGDFARLDPSAILEFQELVHN